VQVKCDPVQRSVEDASTTKTTTRAAEKIKRDVEMAHVFNDCQRKLLSALRCVFFIRANSENNGRMDVEVFKLFAYTGP